MKRRLLWVAGLLAATVVLPITAQAATYFGFNIGISNAPPPRLVYRSQPSLYMVPNTGVYVVEDGYGDMDVFRYGTFYYVYDDGYWYRGRSYRGPFRAVDVRYVPTQVFYVPSNHWRHYPTFLSSHPRYRYRNDRGNWNASGYRRYNDDRRSDYQWQRDSDWRNDDRGDWRDDQGQSRHDNGRHNGRNKR